ncbi:F0F1 ATP synthase subunit B [PVC group bacterium]|nr:F0F1 ATP synthase subunit B [PVC group bacterium]
MGSFDAGLFFWSLLTFGALFLLLARFAFRPLSKALKDREDTIKKSLDEARISHKKAEETFAENKKQLDKAREDARLIIDDGHKIVADMKRESRERAEDDAKQLIERAKTEINKETEKSLDDLKSTVAGLSIRIAHQVIRENLDEKRHDDLADTFIERLKKSRNATRKK